MQTGDTLADFLRFTRRKIDARNDALLAAGHEPIQLPVVFLGDNHGSRFDEQVLEMIDRDPDATKFCGILLDFEESRTSQFLQVCRSRILTSHPTHTHTPPLVRFQMWDQINKAAHAGYNKGKDEYKKHYMSRQ